MKLVKNNPYRIAGLLVGASAKEQQRQKRRLLQFIEAEQEPEEDFSFPILGKVDRTIETVNEAISNLNLDSDRMNSALFWFYKGNEITDEPAFDLLKNSDQKGATEIWLKMIANNEVTKRNSSAFQNLSTLLLCNSFNGQQINDELLEKSIALKLKFLESDFVQDLKAISTDETYKISKKDIQLLFLNQMLGEIDKNGNLDSKKFFNLIDKQQFIAKEEFLKLFIQKPIEKIEKRIAEAKVIRKSSKANAANAGKMLFQQAHPDLLQLNSFIGIPSIKLSTISDKLSGELLQCGIDYFSYYRDSNTDPSRDVMDLFRKAKSLAIGNIAKERCKENMIGLQEWIDSKPERDKQNLVREDFQFITEKLKHFQTISASIESARELIDSCKPKLVNIKTKLSQTDEFYLKMCGVVVNIAEAMIIFAVNDAVEKRSEYVEYINFKNSLSFILPKFPGHSLDDVANALNFSGKGVPPAPEFSLDKLRNIIKLAWKANVSLESIDMPWQQRNYYNTNKESLKKLYEKVNDTIVFFWGDTPIERYMLILAIAIVGIILIAIRS